MQVTQTFDCKMCGQPIQRRGTGARSFICFKCKQDAKKQRAKLYKAKIKKTEIRPRFAACG